ncbi:MAG: hypothetical protein U0527_08295 [Candidatus Eisenbacteria bacterium]
MRLDLSFDRSDRVLFYAVGPDGWYSQYGQPDAPRERFTRDPYNNAGSYWPTWSGRFASGAPKRLASVDGRMPRHRSPPARSIACTWKKTA